MSSSRPPITDPDKAAEQIVAYLDGELSSDSRQELEDRLAGDSQFREQLNNYQETWELLDELPTTMAGDRFTASTIEMVAVAAIQPGAEKSPGFEKLVKRPWLFALVGIGMSFLIGFVVVRATAALFGDTGAEAVANEQLVTDLPLIDRVELYQPIDNIDFLRQLAASEFVSLTEKTRRMSKPGPSRRAHRPEEENMRPNSDSPLASADRDARRAAVFESSADEKQELQRKRRMFAGLAPARRQQIRELHQAVESEADSDLLLATADHYRLWYMRLGSGQQMELAALIPEKRVARIVRIEKQRQSGQDRKRSRGDLIATLRWLGQFAVDHQREIAKHSPHLRRRGGQGAKSSLKRRALVQAMVRHWHEIGEPREPELDARAMDDLLRHLAPEMQREIEKNDGVAAQWAALLPRLQTTYADDLSPRERSEWDSMSARGRLLRMLQDGHRPPRKQPQPHEEDELWDLFNERLSDEERTELEQLPREEILQRLQEYKHERRGPASVPGAGDRRRGEPPRPPRGRPRSRYDGPPPRFDDDEAAAGQQFEPRRPPRGRGDRKPPPDRRGGERPGDDGRKRPPKQDD